MTPHDNRIDPVPHTVFVGTAGWSVPAAWTAEFAGDGTHLQRYASRLKGVEINSSFYRPHKEATYARWAASTPEGFRFAVKAPREITHRRRLAGCEELLHAFLGEAAGLGAKMGPILVQLPPSLAFESASAGHFFSVLRGGFSGSVVCEPRHPSWFGPEGDRLLRDHQAARAAADPAPVPEAARPGGWRGLAYYRLHGSPRIYYSDYADEFLNEITGALRAAAQSGEAWCIFDNTALGAAARNALQVACRCAAGREG